MTRPVVDEDEYYAHGADSAFEYLDGKPDLLVVTDAYRDRLRPTRLDEREKRPRYLAARIPELWWISPRTGSVLVDQLDGDTYRTERIAQGRISSMVLPGFWIDAGWLWQHPLPSTMRCLRELLV